MPNIPDMKAKFGQEVQNIKRGLYGDNGKLDVGDFKGVAKNFGSLGWLGIGKSLWDARQKGIEMQPTTDPTQRWSLQSPIQRSTGQTTSPQDFNNLIPNLDSAINTQYAQPSAFSPSIPKGDYGTTVQDITNVFTPPTDSGLSMSPEEQPAQQSAPQPVPQPVVQPKVTPNKMPMPNDLDFIFGADQSAYQSRTAPSYVDPMKVNNGYFDMNKANTVGGNWINGAGWYTEADKQAGLTEEDVLFNAQMRQRIAQMYS